jgi:hypothetical protein
MLCVLRIAGKDLNEDRIAAVLGTRVHKGVPKGDDRAANVYLSVDVSESDDGSELARRIHEFLKDHERGLLELHRTQGVVLELDIGLLLTDQIIKFRTQPSRDGTMWFNGPVGKGVSIQVGAADLMA